MKFFLSSVVAVLAATHSEAFTANLSNQGRLSTKIAMASPVVSDLISEALQVSEKYGNTSIEARLAWEAVEEVNASDNSAASMGSLNDECDVEVVSQECLEYSAALEELQELIEEHKPVLSNLSDNIASSVKQIKLSAPKTSAAPQSDALKAALEEARSITEAKGLGSPEAAVAWEAVEQIAADGSSNALGGAISADECFVEAAKEACEALEELNRFIESRKQ